MDHNDLASGTSPPRLIGEVQGLSSDGSLVLTQALGEIEYRTSSLIVANLGSRVWSYRAEDWEVHEDSDNARRDLSVRPLERASQINPSWSPQRRRASSLRAAAEAFHREAVSEFYRSKTFVFQALSFKTSEPSSCDDIGGVKSFFLSLGDAAQDVRKVEIHVEVKLLSTWGYTEMIRHLSQLHITHLGLWVITPDEDLETQMNRPLQISRSIRLLIESVAHFGKLEFLEVGRTGLFNGMRICYRSPIPNPSLLEDIGAYCAAFLSDAE